MSITPDRMRRHLVELLTGSGVPQGVEGFHTLLQKLAAWDSTYDLLAVLFEMHAAGKLTERSAAAAVKGLG